MRGGLFFLLVTLGYAAASASVSPRAARAAANTDAPGAALSSRAHAQTARLGLLRGVTVGPIENALHAHRGYGTDASLRTLDQIAAMGGTWISLTPFGRVWNLSPSGVDLTFEAEHRANRDAIRRTVEQAHARGLRVLLVPHLWVETGGWRGEIEFDTEDDWARWADGYTRFITTWAHFAQMARVDLFSVGIEFRSWVTTVHAPRFSEVIRRVREVYSGPLTYAANWDDAEHAVVWGELDVIGINAFFPLADKPDASLSELKAAAELRAQEVEAWSQHWHKPVLFTEFGYTARKDPALRPWEWPEDLGTVAFDPDAQAEAYLALLSSFVEREWFMGFFVWRFYADPYDASQEPEWGFSPLYKPAELALRSAFATNWAREHARSPGASLIPREWRIGVY